MPILKPYKLSSAQFGGGERSIFEIGGRRIGGEHFALIAGPCTVESREQVLETARAVKDAGAAMFRGGAYKPRTSPYAFQGLGQEGLRLLAEAKASHGMPIVTELMDVRDIEPVLEVADVLQIGARNMQNYTLLAEVGRSGCPVLLKRGLSATLEELLMAAEYILKEGNERVILCERGIRTFETAYRFTLDLMAVPVLQAALAPAGRRRPEPRGGPARPGRCRCPGRRRRRGGRASSSRSTRTPRRRSATGPRRSAPTSSRTTPRRSSGRRLSRARRSRPRVNVAVVGVGLIGGSIGLAARDRLERGAGYDPDRGVDAAVERGAVAAAATVRAAVAEPKLVSSPRPWAAGGRSTRCCRGRGRAPSATSARRSGRSSRSQDPRFIGGHPLAGAETSGVEHARADLFDGATWYLTPGPSTSGALYERLHRALVGIGAQPAAIDAAVHDRVMAWSRTSRTSSPTSSWRRRRGPSATARTSPRPARASATRRASPAPTRRSGPTSTSPTATR